MDLIPAQNAGKNTTNYAIKLKEQHSPSVLFFLSAEFSQNIFPVFPERKISA